MLSPEGMNRYVPKERYIRKINEMKQFLSAAQIGKLMGIPRMRVHYLTHGNRKHIIAATATLITAAHKRVMSLVADMEYMTKKLAPVYAGRRRKP